MKSNEQILGKDFDSFDSQMRRDTFYRDSVIKNMKKAQLEILNHLINYDEDESIYDYLYQLRSKIEQQCQK